MCGENGVFIKKLCVCEQAGSKSSIMFVCFSLKMGQTLGLATLWVAVILIIIVVVVVIIIIVISPYVLPRVVHI